ncbi:protein TIC 22, chloroplastic [Apium graveolens]|uniref:protein TIC 22, chloroplastic n=1 Tax=Apium graveolens TaxID=4045 RepID=UPI003D791837
MESPNASSGPPPNPITRLSTFIHRLSTDLSHRLAAANFPAPSPKISLIPANLISPARHLPFASVNQSKQAAQSVDSVAKRLIGTAVYTVSNSSNEFVLMSDPDGVKSIGLLCFRKEDAEAFLSQVRLRKGGGIKGHAKVVPITLDQVYMLKVEGIAFRFMPDPVQIKNALELKASDVRSGFDGVPVFQSDLLVVKKKNKRYCPIYFRKEDIEQELSTVSRSARGPGVSQQIMVGSLEDVLKKMEINEKNSGWEDLIFIPPGKSRSQHIQEVGKA